MLIPTGERINHEIASAGALKSNVVKKEVKPMFTQADLVATMDSLVAASQDAAVIQNPVIKQKDTEKKQWQIKEEAKKKQDAEERK